MELLLVACETQPLLRVNLRQFEQLGMLLYGLALSSLLLFLSRKTLFALSVTYLSSTNKTPRLVKRHKCKVCNRGVIFLLKSYVLTAEYDPFDPTLSSYHSKVRPNFCKFPMCENQNKYGTC